MAIISGIKIIGTGGGGSTTDKYVVPNGMKFAYSALSDFSNLDFSAVRDWDYMFYYCTNLQEIDCRGFNLTDETTLTYMFRSCSNLSSIITDGLDTSNIESVSRLFQGCTSLKSVDLSQWSTSSLTNLAYIFSGCSGLTSVNMSGWDLSRLTTDALMRYAFYGCTSLTELNMDGVTFPDYNINMELDNCTALTVESLLSILNSLPQLDGHTRTLFIGSDNLAKLSDEQKAIATNKGWTLN